MCDGERRLVAWILLTFCWALSCRASEETSTFPREFDFRYTTYEDFMNTASYFQHPDIVGYVQLLVDNDNDQILVGARDSLFRLSLENLSELEQADVRARNTTKNTCVQKGQAEESCFNFIRVLLLHNHTGDGSEDNAVFVCGTNAFFPECSWREAQNLSAVIERVEGIGKAPYNPLHNSSALITESGDFYAATTVDIRARDPIIYRSMGKSVELRTEQYNSKWLNEPDFIASYEIGEFVYFFFREVAVEFINCGKRVYSRVARVCKSDEGGTLLLGSTWTTYYKSRLNCSLPGEYPFYFDEIQSTYFLDEGNEQYLYAVFNTPMNSIAGSAVCVFNMTAFNTSFTGPYKYQDNARSAWERHDNPQPLVKCPEDKDTSKRSFEDSSGRQSMITQKYQLMDLAVQPTSQEPLLHELNERWTHIVVDNVRGKHDTYKVFFIATDDGKIRKMMKEPKTNKTCLIEEIKVVPNGEPKPVKSMKISPDHKGIFISTLEHIIKIPVERCARFTDEDLCLNANDPYCGWHQYDGRCMPAPSQGLQPEISWWTQAMTSCPFVPHPVNGNWSEWSSWGACSQVGQDPTAGDCLCRSRSCDNPSPVYGGNTCQGASVEVTNCTAHGHWTEWSEWSSCTQTCGSTAIRTRNRYCSNPPPKFGGRDCLGNDMEEEYCRGHKPCPMPPLPGNWSEWSEWSECSAKCNGGIQTRKRACKEPLNTKIIPCAGNTQEWRMCNTQICQGIDKMSPWTPWVTTNQTKGGHFEQRFRFTCRAEVPSQDMIKTKHSKSQVRFCLSGGSCRESAVALVPNRDGQWSEWEGWSSCTQKCDGGMMWRRRSCNNPVPLGDGSDCVGHPMEGMECNAHSCQGVWGCWSELSPCSASCGPGMTTRERQCQTMPPGRPFTIPCVGNAQDILPCDVGPCITVAMATSMSKDFLDKEQFTLAQMLLVGGLSFVLGAVASLALFAYIQSFRKAMREARERENLEKMQKALREQKDMQRKLSRISVRHVPSLASVGSRESCGVHFTKNKVYDVESMMRDSMMRDSMMRDSVMRDSMYYDKHDDQCSTLDRSCTLKTFTLKDL